jgi:hypothetical protein
MNSVFNGDSVLESFALNNKIRRIGLVFELSDREERKEGHGTC